MSYIDKFGFLANGWELKFSGGEIAPLYNFKSTTKFIKSVVHEDGFIYPPTEQKAKYSDSNAEEFDAIPNTSKPAHLFSIPCSHSITLENNATLKENRMGDAAFIIHFIGFLLGTRLQFENWRHTGRVPINYRSEIGIGQKTVQNVLSIGYDYWRSLNSENQRLFINILFMHVLAKSYEWSWERFTFEYMAFDGCFHLLKKLSPNIFKRTIHKERIKSVCEHFSIPFTEKRVKEIYELRNFLYHESTWDGGMATLSSSTGSSYAYNLLHQLNQRIITNLIGYKNSFSISAWEGLMTCRFD